MKKSAFFLIIVGAVLCLMPEFTIVADLTTKVAGSALLTVVGLAVAVYLLWRFQVCCGEAIHQMREQKEKELAEQNIEIVYPSLRSLMTMMARFLPRLLGAIVIATAAYLALSFSWHYILPVLKYAAYAAGVCVAVLLVICAMPVKSDDSCETA